MLFLEAEDQNIITEINTSKEFTDSTQAKVKKLCEEFKKGFEV